MNTRLTPEEQCTGRRTPDTSEQLERSPLGRGLVARRAGVSAIQEKLHIPILIVDSDVSTNGELRAAAASMGFITRSAASMSEAYSILQDEGTEILLINAAGTYDVDQKVLCEFGKAYSDCRIIVITTADAVRSFLEVMPPRACEFLVTPFATNELKLLLADSFHYRNTVAGSRIPETLHPSMGISRLICKSPAMHQLYRLVTRVSSSDHPVLIVGESGTGKSLVAEAIHESEANAGKAFLSLHCGSMEHYLLESIFWQSSKPYLSEFCPFRPGIFAASRGGTIFFDDIDALAPDLQIRLMRALNPRELKADSYFPVRVLAATKSDLDLLVDRGQFRRDLSISLKMMVLSVPPLRNRKEDISLLADQFLAELSKVVGERHISKGALDELLAYEWPDNVRELRNVIQLAAQVSTGPLITENDLPSKLRFCRSQEHADELRKQREENGYDNHRTGEYRSLVPLREVTKQTILETLRQMNGDKLMAARALGIGRTTLYRKLKAYQTSEMG